MSRIVNIKGYDLHMIDGVPMVEDLKLGDRLGYAQPRDIRKLIKRLINKGQISPGMVCDTVAQTPGGGRPASIYYLTEKAALKVIVKSETTLADQITDEVIDVFMSVREGKVCPNIDPANLSRKDIILMALDSEERALALEAKVAEMEPQVGALALLTESDGSMCITDSAKHLQVKPKQLFAWLCASRWIYRRSGNKSWLAYQDRMQAGLLEHKVATVERSDGSEKIVEQVRITPKGLAKIGTLTAENDGKLVVF